MKKFFLVLTTAVTLAVCSSILTSCEKENYVVPKSNSNITNTAEPTTNNGITLIPNTINAGGAIYISVDAGYTGNDSRTYTYEVTGGLVEGHGNIALWETPSTSGNHTLKITVSDGKGGEEIKIQSVYIPPSATLLSGFVKLQSTSPLRELKGAKVYLYESYFDYVSGSFCNSKEVWGCDKYVVFNLSGMRSGNYYLAIGNDQAGSKTTSSGYNNVWFYSGDISNTSPEPIKVEDGKVSFCNVCL